MKTQRTIWIAVLLLIAAQMACAAEQGNFSRTLLVNGATDLEVTSGSGDITVRVGDSDKVIVNGRVKASNNGWSLFGGSDGDAQDKINRIVNKPPIEQNGNWIRIGKIDDEDLKRNISISYEIVVPKQTNLHASTGSGDIRTEQVAGPVKLRTGSGNLRLRDLAGDVDAGTGSGDVEASELGGPTHVSTGSGNIHVQENGTGYVRVSTGSGDITVDGAKNSFDASTGSGNVHVSGEIHSGWSIRTGSGDVRLVIPQNSAFNINARASSGSVHTDLPVTMNGSLERHTIRGSVNGGGPTVAITTGSGSIDIQ